FHVTGVQTCALPISRPFSCTFDFEFNSKATELTADPLTNTTLAKYSVTSFVSASITRTPFAKPVFSSTMIDSAIALLIKVRLPVFSAQGIVDELLLK